MPKAVKLPEQQPANDTLVFRKIPERRRDNFSLRHFLLQKKARELGLRLSCHMPAPVNPEEA